jgi:molybdopterin synthase sulfur carrier subunit
MAVTVRLPAALKQWTDGARQVEVPPGCVADALREISSVYPAVGERVLDDEGLPRRFVNIYVNGQDVRFLQGSDTPLGDGDEVIIAPAVAGG